MQVVANENLVRTRVRLASAAHIGALAVFAVGLFVSWNNPIPTFEQMLASYAAIVAGLVLYNIGQVLLRRYGPRFRHDAALVKALKGLDRRHTLLTFPSTKLPDYLLVGPTGVHVLVPRLHGGQVSCRANRWTRDTGGGLRRILRLFGGTPFGDPTRDAVLGVQRVRQRLRDRGIGDGVSVDAIVVFTNPAVRLRIEGCSVPVTTAKNLRNLVRPTKGGRDRNLSEQEGARVVQALVA
ncbi:MAG: hypothetical protein M3O34_14200 [Chloroflexota bacterium]|nr:hypothetical protein [Chloroflexota bacterium]